MKRWIAVLVLVMVLAGLCAASAEGVSAGAVFTKVEVPQPEGTDIIGISPKGDYLAVVPYESIGLIRGGVYTPFTYNESRGVPDEYGYMKGRAASSWFLNADDPIWSPDGRWVILTSYMQIWFQDNSLFPVLMDTETNEYYLLYSAPYENGSVMNLVAFSAASFSADSSRLDVILYDKPIFNETPFGCTLFSWDLATGTRTDIALSLTENALEPFRDQLIEAFGPDDWETEAVSELSGLFEMIRPARRLPDGSLIVGAWQDTLARDKPLLAQIVFDESGASATFAPLPVRIPEEFDSMEYLVGGQRTLALIASGYAYQDCFPCLTAGRVGEEAAQPFMLLYGYPDHRDPGSGEPTVSVLRGDDPLFPELTAADKTKYALRVFDIALSPDGEAAVVLARNESRLFLLHIRLEDLRATVLYEEAASDRTLPLTMALAYTQINNHFVWSQSGTILMTSAGDIMAFRVD